MVFRLDVTVKPFTLDKLIDAAKSRKNKTRQKVQKAALNSFKKVSKGRATKAPSDVIKLKPSDKINRSLSQLLQTVAQQEGTNLRVVDNKRQPFLLSRDSKKLKGAGLSLFRPGGFTADDLKDTKGFLNKDDSVSIREAKKDSIKFLSNLNERGLRKLIGDDKRLLQDIRRGLEKTIFVVRTGKETASFLLLKDINITVNILKPRITVNKQTGKAKLQIELDKKFLNKLLTDNLVKTSNKAAKLTLKNIEKISSTGILDLAVAQLDKKIELSLLAQAPRAFLMNVNQDLPNDRRVLRVRPDRFISSVQFTAILQQQIAKKMPHGPLTGPPLNDTILTFRSGRFVNSINVIINFKKEIITYFFNPIYTKHRETLRNPDDTLIEPSIRILARKLFGKQYLTRAGL